MLGHEKPPQRGMRQDLSAADREELLAFIEKRNWFEAKLESLKALAPVYPFVHPVLVPDPTSTAGYVRAGAESSKWRLPDKAQLAAWVNERNALEDEVDRFDDGDMERMKEKTRQMTRVPLTQPSTDLVEVTLDLILLIDQLLKVLRRRGAVLDLTGLRLQWDDLRYEVSRESESVKAEIDHVVGEAQAWLPGAAATTERRPSVKRVQPSGSTTSFAADVNASPTKRPPPSPSSPSKSQGPRSSLHISILRSQLVGLQTRHRNLAFNLVKRSTTILDRMIDSASRLKDLGGVDGQNLEENQGKHGAIPDILIDLQEEIETKAKEIGDMVTWCSLFETQSKQGHEHYMASTRSHRLAVEALGDIERALTQPASSYQHATLAERYQAAAAALPPAMDGSFPCPTHPAYPSKDAHNAAIVNALTEARAEAVAAVTVAGKALSFYASLLKARESLCAQQTRIQTLRAELRQAVERLEWGSDDAPRPSLADVVENGGVHSEWLREVPSWVASGEHVVRQATDAYDATSLAILQYRKALVNAPMAVKPHLPPGGVVDDLGSLVDNDATDLVALARRCTELTRQAGKDAEALPLLLCVRQDTEELAEEATALRTKLLQAASKAAWSTRMPSPQPQDLDQEVSALSERIGDTSEDFERLQSVVGAGVDLSRISSSHKTTQAAVSTAKHELDVFKRVSKQAETVRAVQDEAEALVHEIDEACTALEDSASSNSPGQAANLRAQVTAWTNDLAQRVPFVAGASRTATPNDSHDRTRSSGPLTPPLTPVDTGASSKNPTSLPDLAALDKCVRNEVNRHSSRVTAAMAQLEAQAERRYFSVWSEPVTSASDSLTAATDRLGDALTILPQSDVVRQRSKTVPERETALKNGLETLHEPIAEVQHCLSALNEALGRGSQGVNMHQAGDVFAAADVTREAALGKLADAKQWQDDMEEMVKTPLEPSPPVVASTKPESATPDSAAKAVRALAAKLDALALEEIVHPSPIVLRTTPKRRRLPDSAAARKLSQALSSISKDARQVAKSQPSSPAVKQLIEKVTRQGALVSELEGLAAVSGAALKCDDVFSKLIDVIDTGDQEAVKAAEGEAQTAVVALERASKPLMDDTRVADEHKRVFRAWTELQSLAEDKPLAPSEASTSVVSPSVASDETAVITPTKPKRREPSASSLRSSRGAPPIALNPDAVRLRTQSNVGRGLRTRPSLDSAQLTPRTPKPRLSAPPLPPSSSKPRGLVPTVAQPFKLSRSKSGSVAADSAPTPTRRAQIATPRSALAPTPKRRGGAAYVPELQSRLDVAVARVLNTLDVDIPVIPAGRDSPDEWKDESGRYWIGTGPRARLCFCRILRSRTVMVRVGGGWMDLSRYLLERFTDALEAPAEEQPNWRTVPTAITSATLAASASLSASRSSLASLAQSPRTPARQGTAELTPSPNEVGAGSPLVPVQFIRKASESPSVREKERERIRSGPSFLRETSTGP